MNNLQLALKELDEEWFASLPEFEDKPPFEVSKEFLKWEQRVIYGKKSASSKVVKVTLIAAALLIIFSVVALSTTKGREFVKHFFKESAVFSFQTERMDNANLIMVKYIPKGFVLEEDYKEDVIHIYHYSYQQNWFEIEKRSIRTTVDFDYNTNGYETIEKNGIIYHITNDNDYCAIIWNCNDYYYQVSGNVDKETAMQIAFGVE